LPETTIRLSAIDNITAIKEASGNLDAAAAIIENTPADFAVYSGDDGLTLPMLSIGGQGIVSVAAHIIGNDMQEMVTLFRGGNVQEAAAMHRKLLPVMHALFAAPNPVPVKTALNLSGVEVGGVRLPMIPLNRQEQLALQQVLAESPANLHKL
jgi:4-hydroxy-tetrahydrodipicolinate synthase